MDRKRVLHMHGHARTERLESKPSDPKESEELGRCSARSPRQIAVAQCLSANRYAQADHEQRGQSCLCRRHLRVALTLPSVRRFVGADIAGIAVSAQVIGGNYSDCHTARPRE